MKLKSIFIAATGQHVGKTTSSLGVLTGLRKHFPNRKINYMKPVGQKYVVVDEVKVDKDVVLFKKWFNVDATPAQMSPVVIPSGYTRDYIDGRHDRQKLIDSIISAHKAVSEGCDMMVIEGTGHTGVGSVIEINNAQVAKELGAKVVLIGPGGLGSSFDELELNRMMFKNYGVDVAGVILNKCNPSKIPMLKDYFSRLLSERWGGVPLLGLVPENPFLSTSTLCDLQKHLKAELLAGEEYGDIHYDNQAVMMVATDLTRFLQKLEADQGSSPLILSHYTRNDVILGYLSHWQKCKVRGRPWHGALILASGSDVNSDKSTRTVHSHIMDTIKAMNVPVLRVDLTTFQIMQRLDSFTPKLHFEDTGRVRVACEHLSDHIDFNLLVERLD